MTATHPSGGPVRGICAVERMSVAQMAEALRHAGANIPPSLVNELSASPKRTQALRARDFRGQGTAFDHILRIAKAGTLHDGSPSATLAADLFGLVGIARRAGSGRCYARTSHTIFTLFHPGEFARLAGDLAVDGAATLANGETVRWNPSTSPVNGNHADYLWGALNQLIRTRELPQSAQLPAVSTQSNREDFAFQGQMANIYTRLFGKPHVNIQGPQSMPYLNEIVARTGPLLAEYGAHGGSVAVISPQNVALGIEAGELEPQPHSHVCNGGCSLGYVVMPVDEAKKYDLQPISYPVSHASYSGDAFQEGPPRRAPPAPARPAVAAPDPQASSLTDRERSSVTDRIMRQHYNNNNSIWWFEYSRPAATRLSAVPDELRGTDLEAMFASDGSGRSSARFAGLYHLSLGGDDERLATAYALHSVESDRPLGDTARFFDRDGNWIGTSARGTWSSPPSQPASRSRLPGFNAEAALYRSQNVYR
jgi:hypothetical protein